MSVGECRTPGGGNAALTAKGLEVLARNHFYVEFVHAAAFISDNLAPAVNKPLERVTVIEDSFK